MWHLIVLGAVFFQRNAFSKTPSEQNLSRLFFGGAQYRTRNGTWTLGVAGSALGVPYGTSHHLNQVLDRALSMRQVGPGALQLVCTWDAPIVCDLSAGGVARFQRRSSGNRKLVCA